MNVDSVHFSQSLVNTLAGSARLWTKLLTLLAAYWISESPSRAVRESASEWPEVKECDVLRGALSILCSLRAASRMNATADRRSADVIRV